MSERLDYSMLSSTEKLKLEARIANLVIALSESDRMLHELIAEYGRGVSATETGITWDDITICTERNARILAKEHPADTRAPQNEGGE